MDTFTKEAVTVSILGKEYHVRELSLAQKNKLLGTISEFLRNIAAHSFFRKDENKALHFDYDDEVSLADLNLDRIILSSIDVLPELLRLAIPDFKDWDNLPESAAREAAVEAVKVQDFTGYVTNFFSIGKAIIR